MIHKRRLKLPRNELEIIISAIEHRIQHIGSSTEKKHLIELSILVLLCANEKSKMIKKPFQSEFKIELEYFQLYYLYHSILFYHENVKLFDLESAIIERHKIDLGSKI